MVEQILKPGVRVIVQSNYPDDGLFNGDTGRVVKTPMGIGVQFDKHDPQTTTFGVVDGGKVQHILTVVTEITPPTFPTDIPMDTPHDTDPRYEQLHALLEAYHETDFGRITTRITSTVPTGLALAYLNGLVAGKWHANGLDCGRITPKGCEAIGDMLKVFSALYVAASHT